MKLASHCEVIGSVNIQEIQRNARGASRTPMACGRGFKAGPFSRRPGPRPLSRSTTSRPWFANPSAHSSPDMPVSTIPMRTVKHSSSVGGRVISNALTIDPSRKTGPRLRPGPTKGLRPLETHIFINSLRSRGLAPGGFGQRPFLSWLKSLSLCRLVSHVPTPSPIYGISLRETDRERILRRSAGRNSMQPKSREDGRSVASLQHSPEAARRVQH